MKKQLQLLTAGILLSTALFSQSITISSETIATSNVAQGAANHIVYIAKAEVAIAPVTITSMQFILSGSHDNNDLTTYRIYVNSTASLAGATLLSSTPANFPSPHTYTDDIPDQTIAAGVSRYFIITVFTDAAATNGSTIKVNGALGPVVFTYFGFPVVNNNQTDAAGVQTITAAEVTISSEAIPSSNISQGSANNIVYIARVDVSASQVSISNMLFSLTGTHDNNDLTTYRIYVNTSPSLTGATFISINSAAFAAPHTYNDDIADQTIPSGATRYFIITVFADAIATAGNTIKVNGSTDPVNFTYTTTPEVINNQSDASGTLTIQAGGVTLSTESIPGSLLYGNSVNNIIYMLKTDLSDVGVTVTSIQFTLTGTNDDNDFTTYRIYVNATPSLTGATLISINPAIFSSPHTYNDDIPDQSIIAGATKYFIITVSVDAAATLGNTVKLNGAVNPVVLTYTTAPPVTNNQTDAAGAGTISGALPVNIISFTGLETANQETLLQWNTSNEINIKEHEIQWSENGIAFNTIGIIKPIEGNSANKEYQFLHTWPAAGNNFYRLIIRDLDGSLKYSPLVKVNLTIRKTKTIVLINPVFDQIRLTFQSPENKSVVLNIQDGNGKVVANRCILLTKGMNDIKWDVAGIAAGVYYISSSDKNISTMKILKR